MEPGRAKTIRIADSAMLGLSDLLSLNFLSTAFHLSYSNSRISEVAGDGESCEPQLR
jgi:hypothetical protein